MLGFLGDMLPVFNLEIRSEVNMCDILQHQQTGKNFFNEVLVFSI